MSTILTTVFYVKRGDTEPVLQAQLLQGNGEPLDLSGLTTVKFTMTRRGSSTPKVNLGTCVIDNAPLGYVSYPWTAPDVDTIGTYDAEFFVTLASGKTQRVPNHGYDTVIVSERLA